MKQNVLVQKVVVGVAALLLVGAVSVQAASAAAQPLVSTGWVEKNLARIKNPKQNEVRLIEVSKQKSYEQGHIPGAVHMQWGAETFDPNTDHMVLTHAQLERIMGGKAAPPEAHIVLYDGDGKHHHVARVYWTLKYWNYDNVSIMDGGKGLWQQQERPLSTASVAVAPQDVQVQYPPNTSVRAMYSPDITHALATGNAVMVDSRHEDFYDGKVYALNKWVRNGHITGAVNVPTMRAMNGDKTYKDRQQLQKLYRQAGVKPDDTVIPYCDTGVLGSHAWFVMHELLGYQNVKMYDGSMREYANRFDTPMEPGIVADGIPTLACGCS
ncbi:MAG: rhodanese-like domain-containing protein [Desulfurivibrio sp.]|nr:rhodanese-like domain-containing protein [Desulfurivibrio sp.]